LPYAGVVCDFRVQVLASHALRPGEVALLAAIAQAGNGGTQPVIKDARAFLSISAADNITLASFKGYGNVPYTSNKARKQRHVGRSDEFGPAISAVVCTDAGSQRQIPAFTQRLARERDAAA
jgi:hypothetical protein